MPDPRNIERVFLLFPPIRLYRETMKLVFSPLGVSYLASSIRQEVDVRIMDAVAEGFHHDEELDEDFIAYGSPRSEIKKRIEAFRPQVVGITCLFSSVFPVIRQICRMVKEVDPDILTVIGGAYPSFLPEYCLSEPDLDLIVLGEGEESFREVLRRLREGRPLSEVDGLAYKEDGQVKVQPKTRWIENLDTIPFPARDLLPMDVYAKINVPHSFSAKEKLNTPLITSRGCPARCIYCSSSRFWGHRFRARSPENVLDEIGELIQRFGIRELQFEDDNFTANKKRAKAILQGILDRGYRVAFNFPNGVALWTLDEELVELIKAAGCYEMTLAFESGSQHVLDHIIQKPLNLERARRITRLIHDRNIRTNAFFIFGFPGETRAQVQETFRFAREMKTNMAYFFIANPLPGTELYRLAKEQGMLPDDFNFENLTFTRSVFKPGVFRPQELERMAGREFLKYNLRAFLRHPWTLFEKSVVDLFLRRPRYTLGLLIRVWKRNFS